MKTLKVIITIALAFIAAIILDSSLNLHATSAIHQIYVNGLQIKATLILILIAIIWK